MKKRNRIGSSFSPISSTEEKEIQRSFYQSSYQKNDILLEGKNSPLQTPSVKPLMTTHLTKSSNHTSFQNCPKSLLILNQINKSYKAMMLKKNKRDYSTNQIPKDRNGTIVINPFKVKQLFNKQTPTDLKPQRKQINNYYLHITNNNFISDNFKSNEKKKFSKHKSSSVHFYYRDNVKKNNSEYSDVTNHYDEMQKDIINFLVKYAEKVMWRLVTLKSKQRREIMRVYFLKYKNLFNNKETHRSIAVRQSNSNTSSSLQKTILRRIISKNNKIEYFLNLYNGFNSFLYKGLTNELKETKKAKELAEEKWRLHKMVEEREKEKKRILKIAFDKYKKSVFTSQLISAYKIEKMRIEQENKMKKERVINKIVMYKYNKISKLMHDNFVKLYYRGLYRQMIGKVNGATQPAAKEKKEEQKQPEQKTAAPTNTSTCHETNNSLISQNPPSTNQTEPENAIQVKEEPKPQIKISLASKLSKSFTTVEPGNKPEEERVNKMKQQMKKARDLRRLIANKGKKNNNDILRKYFHKFYMAGVYKKIRDPLKKKEKIVEEKEDKNGEKKQIVVEKNYYAIQLEKRKNEERERQKRLREQEEERAKSNAKMDRMVYRWRRLMLMGVKECFEKWNLRAKILRIKAITKPIKKKKARSKSMPRIEVNNLEQVVKQEKSVDKELEKNLKE